MSENETPQADANQTDGVALDPQFFTATNAYLELANQQAQGWYEACQRGHSVRRGAL